MLIREYFLGYVYYICLIDSIANARFRNVILFKRNIQSPRSFCNPYLQLLRLSS
jgi:hypothetical protein